MNLYAAWPAMVCVLLALGTTAVLSRWLPPPPSPGRFAAIDGLRGYLALLVFVHHSVIWYGYTATGDWGKPDTALYTYFGRGCVLLFFMITSFLFFNKLLQARQDARPVDWLRLYVSRVTRLAPMYLVAMALLALGVGLQTHWHLQQAPGALAGAVAHWVLFNLRGYADVNGLADTHLVLAGVTWSLAYEWMFYAALPVLALALRLAVPWPVLLPGLLVLVLGWNDNHQPAYALAFGCGMAAAWLLRRPGWRAWLARPALAWPAAACVAAAVLFEPRPTAPLAVLALALPFTLLAAGNSFFGLATHRLSRLLGEFTYSLYLLHGFVLFIVMRTRLGHPVTVLQHWSTVWLLTPLLVALSALTYHFIERPALGATDPLVARLRAWRVGRRAPVGELAP